MAYRELTKKQFKFVKDFTAYFCRYKDFRTIGQYKRVGNVVIDMLETKELTYEDMLQDEISDEIVDKIVARM